MWIQVTQKMAKFFQHSLSLEAHNVYYSGYCWFYPYERPVQIFLRRLKIDFDFGSGKTHRGTESLHPCFLIMCSIGREERYVISIPLHSSYRDKAGRKRCPIRKFFAGAICTCFVVLYQKSLSNVMNIGWLSSHFTNLSEKRRWAANGNFFSLSFFQWVYPWSHDHLIGLPLGGFMS
jgi:hypothetical protein